MFIDNALSDSIKIMTTDEFAQFIMNKRNLSIKMSVECLSKITEIAESELSINENIINALFFNSRPNEFEYQLLERYFNILYSRGITPKYPLNHDINALFILLLDPVKVKDSNKEFLNCDEKYDILKDFYQRMLDIYVPSYNAIEIATAFSKYFKFNELLSHLYDTTYYTEVFKKADLLPQEEIDGNILFYNLSDIFSKNEIRLSAFRQLQSLSLKYNLIEKEYEIVDRYLKYFNDSTIIMIRTLALYFTYDDFKKHIYKFIEDLYDEYYNKFGENILVVIKCLINDVLLLFSFGSVYYNNWDEIQKFIKYDLYLINHIDDIKIMHIAIEAYKKDSVAIHNGTDKIYKAYKTYKNAEDKVDSQITKAVDGVKGVLVGDVKSEIIEGKKFSAIGILKKLLGTVAIFSYSKIAGVIMLVVKYALKKQTTIAEREKIILELQGELEIITEKIDDAKSDNNREAKYAMMRTKTDLENALRRIQMGLEADQRSISTAKATIKSIRGK